MDCLGFLSLWFGVRRMVGLATKQMCVGFGRWTIGSEGWQRAQLLLSCVVASLL